MGRKFIVIDDVSGKELDPDTPSIRIQVAEQVWETYLSQDSAQKVIDAVAELLAHYDGPPRDLETDPEPAPMPTRTRAKSASVSATPAEKEAQRTAIREWVEASTLGALQGVVIGDRGRIPQHVLDSYYKAHPKQPKLFGSTT